MGRHIRNSRHEPDPKADHPEQRKTGNILLANPERRRGRHPAGKGRHLLSHRSQSRLQTRQSRYAGDYGLSQDISQPQSHPGISDMPLRTFYKNIRSRLRITMGHGIGVLIQRFDVCDKTANNSITRPMAKNPLKNECRLDIIQIVNQWHILKRPQVAPFQAPIDRFGYPHQTLVPG